jgi:hypothetical protein
MDNLALVFLRRSAAHGIGHVGWAFAEDMEMFLAGAVENPHGTVVTAPADMGFWIIRTQDPINPMRTRRYNEFKVLDVTQGDPSYARHVAAWVRQQPYKVIGCNCMDAAYDILRAYGASKLPPPAHYWEPDHWFDHVAGNHYRITGEGIVAEDDAAPPVVFTPELPDSASLNTDHLLTDVPSAPDWRVPGSEAALAFQAALQAVSPPPPADMRAPRPLPSTFMAKLRRWLGLAPQQSGANQDKL